MTRTVRRTDGVAAHAFQWLKPPLGRVRGPPQTRVDTNVGADLPHTLTVEEGHTMERIYACKADELEPGSTMTVEGATPVAVYRTEDGEWFASDDSCTHEQFSLGSESDLEDEEVVCPLHMARFDLRTGKPLCFPATIALRMHEVVVERDEVYVVLAEAATSGPAPVASSVGA